MAEKGVRTDNIGNRVSLAKEVLVNDESGTGLQPYGELANQLAGVGAVAEKISGVQQSITHDKIFAESWSELAGRSAAEDGQGAEVVVEDEGTHNQATATGYDGPVVDNAGQYKAVAGWGRWLRIGDPPYSKFESRVTTTELRQSAQERVNVDLRQRLLLNDAARGWAFPFFNQGGVIGGWKDWAGTFMARTFRASMTEDTDLPDSSLGTPLAKDMAGKVAIGVLKSGQTFIHDILMRLRSEASVLPDRSIGTPIVRDKQGRVAMSVRKTGEIFIHRLAGETVDDLASRLQGEVIATGQLIAGVPGYNHRSYDADHYLITVPTFFGPVDVLWKKSGTGIAFAATNEPIELLSCSGQSNTMAGGGFPDLYGFVTKGISDPHRAFEAAGHRAFGDGDGSAPPWQPGDIAALAPAGRDTEQGGINQWTPDAIQFSVIAQDQYKSRVQRIYMQLTSAEGGTSLLEYMPGTAKGDNIAGMINEASSMLQSQYGRPSIMHTHFLIGHEMDVYTGYDSYGDLLSAFADYVLGVGEALPGNVAAGLRPKLLAYQPNDAITEPLGNIKSTALDTLSRSFTDPDIVCIGPVYHERTTDYGIHMMGKLMTADLFAHVHDIVREGGDFRPLHAKRDGSGNREPAVRTGTTIEIVIEGPDGILEFDQDWLDFSLQNHGLQYVDDTNSASITAVELYSYRAYQDRKIIITLDNEPTGSNPRIVISGVENTTDPHRPGGMTDIYVSGPPSFWHPHFPRYVSPEKRFYLSRDIVPVTTGV